MYYIYLVFVWEHLKSLKYICILKKLKKIEENEKKNDEM